MLDSPPTRSTQFCLFRLIDNWLLRLKRKYSAPRWNVPTCVGCSTFRETFATFWTMTDPSEEGVSPSLLGGLFQRILEDCKVGNLFSFSSFFVVCPPCRIFSFSLNSARRLIVRMNASLLPFAPGRRMRSRDPISPYFSLSLDLHLLKEISKSKSLNLYKSLPPILSLSLFSWCSSSKYLMKDKVSSRVAMTRHYYLPNYFLLWATRSTMFTSLSLSPNYNCHQSQLPPCSHLAVPENNC